MVRPVSHPPPAPPAPPALPALAGPARHPPAPAGRRGTPGQLGDPHRRPKDLAAGTAATGRLRRSLRGSAHH